MNTKILLRTITDPEKLQNDLEANNFKFQLEDENLRVGVSYSDVEAFEKIVKKYFNAPYNYANIKFPDMKLNVLVFPNKTFRIDDDESNREAKEWAVSIGLPKSESEWTTFYNKNHLS